MKRIDYEARVEPLQHELVKLMYWLQHKGERVILIFEGRDASGKGGMVKTFTERLNPRAARIVALPAPTERERTQWYFQRYVAELPSASELVIFDRSWYNRAGVERVMGFCTDTEYREFLRSCPEFERMLARSGIRIVKYWLSVSEDEQWKRFSERVENPAKRWKLSPIDLQSITRWEEYSRAKDDMFVHTDIDECPWWVVESDDKRAARLNCITHFLGLFDYGDAVPPKIELPPQPKSDGYHRPPHARNRLVPEVY